MKRHLVVLDIDGTLLRGRRTLSQYAAKTLHRLQEEGHIIVLASGRPIRAMMPFYKQAGLRSPIISYNGLLVSNPFDDSFIPYRRAFEREVIESIRQEAKPLLSAFMAESETCIYADKKDFGLARYFPYHGIDAVIGDKEVKEDTYTCLFRCGRSKVSELKAIVESHKGYNYRHWTSAEYSEICFPDADKGAALLYLMKALCIEKEDVIAIGDSDNDLAMLEAAGQAFVVKDCKAKRLLSLFPSTERKGEDGAVRMLEKLLSD